MSKRLRNITPELQAEITGRIASAGRVGADVFPTLQGTGIKVFFLLMLGKQQNHYDGKKAEYIVIRWYKR